MQPSNPATEDPHEVFLSYRRDIDMDVVGRLYDHLKDKFWVFYDIKMAPGAPFDEVTLGAVRRAPVVLAVIGMGWMKSLPRLQDPGDWVYRELDEALKRKDVRVIPVLVHRDVEMPKPEMLPEALRPLCFRQSLRLRADAWERDLVPLLESIGRHLSHPSSSETRNPREIAHLCNRDDQVARLRTLCETSRSQRSLLCVLPGHEWEGHDGFRRRVSAEGVLHQGFGLPRDDAAVEIEPLRLTSEPDRALALRKALKTVLLTSERAPDPDLWGALSRVRSPTVFWMEVVPEDLEIYGNDVLQVLGRAWKDLMGKLPSPPSQPILLWIDVVHEHPAPNGRLAGPEEGPADGPGEGQVREEGHGQLPELTPVDRHHIRRWMTDPDVRGLIRGHEEPLKLLATNEQYCSPLKPGKLHMERFADAVDRLLKTG